MHITDTIMEIQQNSFVNHQSKAQLITPNNQKSQ